MVATPTTTPTPYLEQITDQPTKRAISSAFDQIATLTFVTGGGYTGTLNPDQKPKLTLKESGTQFFSTDFARAYRWTGSVWEDMPNAPSRFSVTLFAQFPEPPIGWALCDGRQVSRSTSTGGVALFTTPTLALNTRLQYWCRL